MTRDGLIEVNETQQTAERISKREQDADFQKSPEQQAAQDGTQLQGVASPISPLPHAPGAAPARDTATAERVMELYLIHILDGMRTYHGRPLSRATLSVILRNPIYEMCIRDSREGGRYS